MVSSSTRADFGLKIDFAKDTENPGRVFHALYGLIDFCQVTDKTLIKYLELDIEPTLLLEDIEQGSITVWLKTAFHSLQDKKLRELNFKLLNSYLVEAKLYLVQFLQERQTIQDKSEFSYLKNKFIELAGKTGTNELGIYTPPSDKDLLTSIDKFQSAKSELQSADRLYYLVKSSNYGINTNFNLSQEARENLLVMETLENECEMTLKVKKPNYLGESKWEFKDKRKTIEVKINDLDWLNKFKNREVYIAPRDAVKAKVKVISKYDFQSKLISCSHSIEKVIKVIPKTEQQLSLFNDKDLENQV